MKSTQFPNEYRHIAYIWLFKRTKAEACDICGQKAEYIILDHEGGMLRRCQKCFSGLSNFTRILLVERNYWDNVLSKHFHSLRFNPSPKDLPVGEEAKTQTQEIFACSECGCRFLTETDLESHLKAWHTPGGVYYG
jgi:hypothetical protein